MGYPPPSAALEQQRGPKPVFALQNAGWHKSGFSARAPGDNADDAEANST